MNALKNRAFYKAIKLLVFLGICGCWGQVFAETLRTSQSLPSGYLDSVTEERNERVVEMLIVPKPTAVPSLRDRIFDDRLTKEFQSQYELKFGQTEAQRNINSPGRFDEYEYSTGKFVSIEEDHENRKKFGEFMFRRLSEHHVDLYARSNPDVRPVYELKERLANVNVQVKKGYKIRMRYSYSGNYATFRVENPYEVETNVTLQMNPSGFGPSEVEETIYNLGYPITKEVKISSQYAVSDGIVSLITTKKLSETTTTSLTGSTYTHDGGTSIRQDLLLLGITWNQ